MSTAGRQLLETRARLAEQLGPLVHNGVLPHFYLSRLPLRDALTTHEISDAWRRATAEIKAGRTPELLNLYVHIPFCRHKCHYCIYHSVGGYAPPTLEAYLDRLHDEIEHYSSVVDGVRFVNGYIGGGTPSVLDERQLSDLLGHLSAAFPHGPGGEWTFECSPFTITEGKARLFEQHGFNRVSFGVQSLNQVVLDAVNRGCQAVDRVVETVRMMKACRFYINADLIHGLPKDSLPSLRNSLLQAFKLLFEQAVAARPDSLVDLERGLVDQSARSELDVTRGSGR